MKNAEPRTESSHGAQTPSQAVGASPVRSAREPIPRQSVEDNLLSNSLPFKDQTGDFLHQLSQTLTSLRGFLELALLVDSDAQEYRKVIQQSLAQAETLVQLFKSYRALGEGGASDLVNGVGELVRVALGQLRSLSDSRHLSVHVTCGDNCLVLTIATANSPFLCEIHLPLSHHDGS